MREQLWKQHKYHHSQALICLIDVKTVKTSIIMLYIDDDGYMYTHA